MTKFSVVCLLSSILVAVPAVLAQPFIINHGKAIAVTRLDPIVNPGGISGHTHFIVGGSAFSSVYDGPTYVNAKCTTANVEVDKSNYWTPLLYWKANDGTYSIVKHGGANTYYNNRFSSDDTDSDQVFPFPAGFAMLGGNPSLRGPGTTINDKASSFACLDGDGGPETSQFPSVLGKKCGSWRAQINMPNCWDGKRATSADNSHVSYPIGSKENGVCPAGFKRIPAIFYEFFYEIKGYDLGQGKLVLSNGDETGYSFHGDFVNGWDQTFIESAVKNCYGKANDSRGCKQVKDVQNYDGSKCTTEGQLVDELIGDTSKLAALPGMDGKTVDIKDVKTGNTVQGAAPAPAMPAMGGADKPAAGGMSSGVSSAKNSKTSTSVATPTSSMSMEEVEDEKDAAAAKPTPSLGGGVVAKPAAIPASSASGSKGSKCKSKKKRSILLDSRKKRRMSSE